MQTWLPQEELSLEKLMAHAARLRDDGHGNVVTCSRKVFIPLTRLCRDVCHYCTFAQSPKEGVRAYLSPDEVLGIARAGARAGCQEALFRLGDKPELRYRQAREELDRLGHASTISYLVQTCELVREETGLLPHANPGVMSREEIAALRRVCPSQGLMLESVSERLCELACMSGRPLTAEDNQELHLNSQATKIESALRRRIHDEGGIQFTYCGEGMRACVHNMDLGRSCSGTEISASAAASLRAQRAAGEIDIRSGAARGTAQGRLRHLLPPHLDRFLPR